MIHRMSFDSHGAGARSSQSFQASSGCRSRSRSWMCQCCGSLKKSWRLLLVRSSATLVQATGDGIGGRAHICRGDNTAEQVAQRRPGERLCPALLVLRVRLPAGDEQHGLGCDAEVRHSGGRPHRYVTIVVLAWWNPCIIRLHCAADWSWRRASRQGQRCS